MTDLPPPKDAFDELLIKDIEHYGWQFVHVLDEHPDHESANASLPPDPIYTATFGYTVGLWETQAHPELVLVGRWERAHSIMVAAVSLVKEGHHFVAGEQSQDVVQGSRFDLSRSRRFGASSCSPMPPGLIIIARSRHCSWYCPDATGRWPWDSAYSSHPQPLLH